MGLNDALILIVEDEAEIATILRSYLEREGFRTITAEDGLMALSHYHYMNPDLVLLDMGLPKRDGFGVLSEIRIRRRTPVIVVSARNDDLDKLAALRMGADDYVVKPFNPLEVVARVSAVLRRVKGDPTDLTIRYGPLELDPVSYTAGVATDEGVRVLDLTLTEYRLLALLARNPRRVFERAELVDACLREGGALEKTVDSHVSNLRRKLERVGLSGWLMVVRGVGYRLSST